MEYYLEHFGPCSFGIRRLETHQEILCRITVWKQNEHLHQKAGVLKCQVVTLISFGDYLEPRGVVFEHR
jgi:hypothetical protein